MRRLRNSTGFGSARTSLGPFFQGSADRRGASHDTSNRNGASLPATEIKNPGNRVEGFTYAEMLSGQGEHKRGEGRLERVLNFRSEEEDKAWLQRAFTGRLKEKFSWEGHREELLKEVGGKLILTDLGSRLILIRSGSDESTEKALKGFDEWAKFWFSWWKPWDRSVANQSRTVWTRWTGVPLQAWSPRFFHTACSQFGRLVELHEITSSRRRLDEAFVKVFTGLVSCDKILPCNIDGVLFPVKIEEICCDEVEDLWDPLGEAGSESEFSSSNDDGWADKPSLDALLEGLSESDGAGGGSVNGGGEETQVPATNMLAGETNLLGVETSAALHYELAMHADAVGTGKGGDQQPHFNCTIGNVEGVGSGDRENFSNGPRFEGIHGLGLEISPTTTRGNKGALESGAHISIRAENSHLVCNQPNVEKVCATVLTIDAVRADTSGGDLKCSSGKVCSRKGRKRKEANLGRLKIRKGKEISKPYDPKTWVDFIGPMASSGEIGAKRREQRIRGSGADIGQSSLGKELLGVDYHEFGEKVGLVTVDSPRLQSESSRDLGGDRDRLGEVGVSS